MKNLFWSMSLLLDVKFASKSDFPEKIEILGPRSREVWNTGNPSFKLKSSRAKHQVLIFFQNICDMGTDRPTHVFFAFSF